MPRQLAPCPACHRHVLVDDDTCAFCGDRLVSMSRRALGALTAASMGLAVSGCPVRPAAKYGMPPQPQPDPALDPAPPPDDPTEPPEGSPERPPEDEGVKPLYGMPSPPD